MENDNQKSDFTLEKYRGYLTVLARQHIDSHIRDRVDLSGIVQQTLLEAHGNRTQFRGANDAEWEAWLRKILAHNVADEVRKIHADKRDIGREVQFEASLQESSARLEAWLVAGHSSPSQQAMRHEQLLKLADALTQLPEDQRIAVELHHLQGRSLAMIAQEMERSKSAVAGLLHRGLENLRHFLDDSNEN